MKLYKVIGASLLSISLLGLFGCSNNKETHDTKKPDHTEQSNHNESENASNNDEQSSQNDHSSQNDDSDKNISEKPSNQSSSDAKTEKTPKTNEEVLAQIAKGLKTKAPVMLPTNVPVTVGKYLTAMTHSENWYYRIQFYETNQPTVVNSKAASNGTPIVTIEGTMYKDEASARDAVSGYMKVDPPKDQMVDLGYGIIGMMEGATGHAYISWNEGRWCIKIDSPSDLAYRNKKYPDHMKLAKDIVTYLEKYALPAPQKYGVITIRNWDKSPETIVQWQDHKTVYQITSEDPMKALEVAVNMQ